MKIVNCWDCSSELQSEFPENGPRNTLDEIICEIIEPKSTSIHHILSYKMWNVKFVTVRCVFEIMKVAQSCIWQKSWCNKTVRHKKSESGYMQKKKKTALNVHIVWNKCHQIFYIIANDPHDAIYSHTHPYFWNRVSINDKTK